MKQPCPLIRTTAAIPVGHDSTPLAPLTCQIEKGSLVCFLGQRFSVLNLYLQMLAGLTEPHFGTVEHFITAQKLCEHCHFPPIAYLNYKSTLLSILSGLENVKLPALYHQLGSKAEIDQQAQGLLNELNYPADHTVLPAFMSTLQKRHLLIARALILKPQVLFIENPFADLELEEAAILERYLAGLVENKQITLITSHANLDFVEHYAQRIIYAEQNAFHFFDDWSGFSAYRQRNRLKF